MDRPGLPPEAVLVHPSAGRRLLPVHEPFLDPVARYAGLVGFRLHLANHAKDNQLASFVSAGGPVASPPRTWRDASQEWLVGREHCVCEPPAANLGCVQPNGPTDRGLRCTCLQGGLVSGESVAAQRYLSDLDWSDPCESAALQRAHRILRYGP